MYSILTNSGSNQDSHRLNDAVAAYFIALAASLRSLGRRVAYITFMGLVWCGIAIGVLLLVSFATGYEGWLDVVIAGLKYGR